MPKSLRRIVAFLLVPVLLLDPVTASALIKPLAPLGKRVGVKGDITTFHDQALQMRLISDEKPFQSQRVGFVRKIVSWKRLPFHLPLVGALLALDIGTKVLMNHLLTPLNVPKGLTMWQILARAPESAKITVLPNLMTLVNDTDYVGHEGMVFWILKYLNYPHVALYGFIMLAVLFWFIVHPSQYYSRLFKSLLLAGGLVNVSEVIWRGGMTDWIMIPAGIFNLADLWILGAVLTIGRIFIQRWASEDDLHPHVVERFGNTVAHELAGIAALQAHPASAQFEDLNLLILMLQFDPFAKVRQAAAQTLPILNRQNDSLESVVHEALLDAAENDPNRNVRKSARDALRLMSSPLEPVAAPEKVADVIRPDQFSTLQTFIDADNHSSIRGVVALGEHATRGRALYLILVKNRGKSLIPLTDYAQEPEDIEFISRLKAYWDKKFPQLPLMMGLPLLLNSRDDMDTAVLCLFRRPSSGAEFADLGQFSRDDVFLTDWDVVAKNASDKPTIRQEFGAAVTRVETEFFGLPPSETPPANQRAALTAEERIRLTPSYENASSFFIHYNAWRTQYPDAKLFVLLRHAQTRSNIIQSIQDYESFSPLSIRGVRQRDAFTRFMRENEILFDRFIAPDIERPYETLKRAAEEAGVEIEVKRRFREVRIQPIGGIPWVQGDRLFPGYLEKFIDDPFEFSIGPFYAGQRIRKYGKLFRRELEKGMAQNVIAASSGMTKLLFLLEFLQIPSNKYHAMFTYLNNPPNASITILGFDPKSEKWNLLVYGDNSYLPSHLRGKATSRFELFLNHVRFDAMAAARALLRPLNPTLGRIYSDYYPHWRQFLPLSDHKAMDKVFADAEALEEIKPLKPYVQQNRAAYLMPLIRKLMESDGTMTIRQIAAHIAQSGYFTYPAEVNRVITLHKQEQEAA